MAGGTWEYVAGIYTAGASNENRSKLWDPNNSKYVDKYTDYGNTNKYGDAVYETSSSGNSLSDSWDSSHSGFPNSNAPVFARGGHAASTSSAGVFAFIHNKAEAYTYYGFRPVVISSKP